MIDPEPPGRAATCALPSPTGDATAERIEAAIGYARRGWGVIPLYGVVTGVCACGDVDCGKPGKHPTTRHGVLDATTDEGAIRRWWKSRSNANVAIATGAASGLVVLDVDPRHAGDEALRRLEKAYGPLPPTVEVVTGGGGRHLYFRHPGLEVRSPEIAPGLEVKGEGTYVVAPPSLHVSGRRYEWEVSGDPDDIPLAALPAWVLATAVGSRAPSAASAGAPIHDGQRNLTLASLAGTMRRRGMTEPEILAALMVVNRRCTPPLDKREIERVAASVARYEPAEDGDGRTAEIAPPTDRWKFLTPDDLNASQGAGVDWVIEGILAKGQATLMPGIWKAGKTTLIGYYIKAISAGSPFCGLKVHPGLVTVVSEENAGLWNMRVQALGLQQSTVDFLLRPFPMGRPTMKQWLDLIAAIAEHAKGRALVVMDSIHNLWGVEQENDNAEQLRWLEPLHAIMGTGAALLLAGHPSKAEQAEGRVTRGGGAMAGWVSILTEFRRYAPGDPTNAMRVLTGFSRFEETPRELVIELVSGAYQAVGTRAEVKVSKRLDEIVDLLPNGQPGLSAADILERWSSEGRKPSRRTIETDLANLLRSERVGRTGEGGTKDDPFRWFRR